MRIYVKGLNDDAWQSPPLEGSPSLPGDCSQPHCISFRWVPQKIQWGIYLEEKTQPSCFEANCPQYHELSLPASAEQRQESWSLPIGGAGSFPGLAPFQRMTPWREFFQEKKNRPCHFLLFQRQNPAWERLRREEGDSCSDD